MIISASRRTDIPAFYSNWFMNRIRKGYFYRVNPFNSKQVSCCSLKPEDVDAICFWTKDPKPLMQHLDELDERGLNYYFQVTLNPYDSTFEPHLPPLQGRIETFRELADRIGPARVVWRYDPIILSSSTPVSFHLESMQELAEKLGGYCSRLMFSFHDFYGKGRGRLHKTLADEGIKLEDITAIDKRESLEQVVRGFKQVTHQLNLQIFTCSENIDLSAFGIDHGACIDGDLIRKLFCRQSSVRKDKYQRNCCGCVESVDMGSYNSCSFKCAYCYANFNGGMIESNCRKHDPASPALLGRYEEQLEIRTT
jgi:hypothetical protein